MPAEPLTIVLSGWSHFEGTIQVCPSGSVAGRVLLEGRVVHSPDVLADPDFTYGDAQKLGGYRTVLGVPLLREGSTIGVIILTRRQVPASTEKQIELVTT